MVPLFLNYVSKGILLTLYFASGQVVLEVPIAASASTAAAAGAMAAAVAATSTPPVPSTPPRGDDVRMLTHGLSIGQGRRAESGSDEDAGSGGFQVISIVCDRGTAFEASESWPVGIAFVYCSQRISAWPVESAKQLLILILLSFGRGYSFVCKVTRQ